MNKTSLALLASLAANAVLFAFVFQSRPASTAPANPITVASTQRPLAPNQAKPAAALSAADQASLTRAQALLATDDFPLLVARLRAAGFSPRDIKAIVTARVADRFGALRKAAVAQQAVVPYWRSTVSFPNDPKAGAEIRRLFEAQNTTLREVLGADFAASDEWSALIQERKSGYLPPEKADRLNQIIDDYNDLRRETYWTAQGVMLPEDQQKIALLEKEQRDDLTALFTPEELEAYELRTNPIAHQLRNQLSSFQPTEEEFKNLYRIEQAARAATQAGDSIPAQIRSDPAALQKYLQAIQADKEKQIDTTLGTDRAAAYRMMIDPNYQYIDKLATRLALPAATVPQVYTVSKDYQTRAQALWNNQALTPENRSVQLNALAAEAETQLGSLLGPRGFEIYRNQAGAWINTLKLNAPARTTLRVR